MLKTALTVTLLLACSALSMKGVTPNLEKTVDNEACMQWVDSVYNSLSPRERVAQLIFPKVEPSNDERCRLYLKSLVEINQVGGLLFGRGTLEQYVEVTNYAQSMAKVPLLMVFDGEWGLSMRIKGTPRFPRNMALGAVNDTSLTYRYGKEMARESRAAGIHVNFAPVLDVNTNPKNPVIGDRSFGSDPETVSRLGIAYSRGLEDGGMQAVAKHFPGHGDTDSDSHKTLPTVHYSYEYLDTTHLVPFRDFINEGFSGIMTAHLTLPLLDATLTPASLSPAITGSLLKDKMGFEGLIYTDALSMRGARVEGKNNALMALKAGADVLESSYSPVADIEAIAEAADKGEISWQLIEERCKKILKYKYILGLPQEKYIEIAGLEQTINSPEAEALNRELSRRSLTLLWNRGNTLPLGNLGHNTIAAVTIGDKPATKFLDMCRKYASVDTFSTIDKDNIGRILEHKTVICAVTKPDSIEIEKWNMLGKAENLVAVFLIDPYKVEEFKPLVDDASAVLLTYDDTPLLQEYAAQALFGGCAVTGTLPVTLEGIAARGTGVMLKKSRLGFSTPLNEGLNPAMVEKMDSIVDEAVAAGAFPGAQLLVAKNGNVVVNKNYGAITNGGAPVTDNTVFDLASVSKTLGTLPVVMKAYDSGLFNIDDPVSAYIPGMDSPDKKDITVRELLFHESGMPASLNMYDVMGEPGHKRMTDFRLRKDITSAVPTEVFDIEADSGIYVGKITYDSIMNRIYTIPLRNNKDYNYSCLNFCLLMDLNQRVTGIDQRTYLADSILNPIGALTTCYRPTELHAPKDIAYTELDTIMRHQHLHGYVHDELANFSGGVQGNAGLFSNALDMAKICSMWLNGGTYGDTQVLSEPTVELFTTTKSPNSRRGLGFDKPDTKNPAYSPTCREADLSVYGHTGYTGTIFWVDPKNDVIFIFLNNRVDPTRNNKANASRNVRSELFREVYNAMNNNQ